MLQLRVGRSDTICNFCETVCTIYGFLEAIRLDLHPLHCLFMLKHFCEIAYANVTGGQLQGFRNDLVEQQRYCAVSEGTAWSAGLISLSRFRPKQAGYRR